MCLSNTWQINSYCVPNCLPRIPASQGGEHHHGISSGRKVGEDTIVLANP